MFLNMDLHVKMRFLEVFRRWSFLTLMSTFRVICIKYVLRALNPPKLTVSRRALPLSASPPPLLLHGGTDPKKLLNWNQGDTYYRLKRRVRILWYWRWNIWEFLKKSTGISEKSDISSIILVITSKLVDGYFFTKTNIICQILSRSNDLKKKEGYPTHQKKYSSFCWWKMLIFWSGINLYYHRYRIWLTKTWIHLFMSRVPYFFSSIH